MKVQMIDQFGQPAWEATLEEAKKFVSNNPEWSYQTIQEKSTMLVLIDRSEKESKANIYSPAFEPNRA